jgi:hypothetical protein
LIRLCISPIWRVLYELMIILEAEWAAPRGAARLTAERNVA